MKKESHSKRTFWKRGSLIRLGNSIRTLLAIHIGATGTVDAKLTKVCFKTYSMAIVSSPPFCYFHHYFFCVLIRVEA